MNKNPNAKELKQDSTSVSLLNKTHFPACPGLWLVGRAPGARNALGTSRSTRGALLAAAPRSAPEQSPPASAPGSHQLPYVTLLCICLEGPATGAVPHKGAGAGARQSVSPRCVPAVAGSAAQGGAGGTRRGRARLGTGTALRALKPRSELILPPPRGVLFVCVCFMHHQRGPGCIIHIFHWDSHNGKK